MLTYCTFWYSSGTLYGMIRRVSPKTVSYTVICIVLALVLFACAKPVSYDSLLETPGETPGKTPEKEDDDYTPEHRVGDQSPELRVKIDMSIVADSSTLSVSAGDKFSIVIANTATVPYDDGSIRWYSGITPLTNPQVIDTTVADGDTIKVDTDLDKYFGIPKLYPITAVWDVDGVPYGTLVFISVGP